MVHIVQLLSSWLNVVFFFFFFYICLSVLILTSFGFLSFGLFQVVGESGLFTPDHIAYVQAAGVKAVSFSHTCLTTKSKFLHIFMPLKAGTYCLYDQNVYSCSFLPVLDTLHITWYFLKEVAFTLIKVNFWIFIWMTWNW